MSGRRSREEQRELLLEAFLGGWQAALGQYVHPRARPVVEACFDLWLEEAADEAEILGLAFRRRRGLPHRAGSQLRFDLVTGEPFDQEGRSEVPAVVDEPPPAAGPPPVVLPVRGPRVRAVRVPRIPRQRRSRDRVGASTRQL